MLFNKQGLVWSGRRLPKWSGDKQAYIWQMPQGGIDKRESPREAAVRELREETGITSADIVGEIPRWLSYDLPDELLGIALKGKYRGQRQRWFAMHFWGDDSEIDISGRGGNRPEFDAWQWVPLADVPRLAVDFRRSVYEEVAQEFARFGRRRITSIAAE